MISAMWIQDWSGKIQTNFGTRVFWNWRWNSVSAQKSPTLLYKIPHHIDSTDLVSESWHCDSRSESSKRSSAGLHHRAFERGGGCFSRVQWLWHLSLYNYTTSFVNRLSDHDMWLSTKDSEMLLQDFGEFMVSYPHQPLALQLTTHSLCVLRFQQQT